MSKETKWIKIYICWWEYEMYTRWIRIIMKIKGIDMNVESTRFIRTPLFSINQLSTLIGAHQLVVQV